MLRFYIQFYIHIVIFHTHHCIMCVLSDERWRMLLYLKFTWTWQWHNLSKVHVSGGEKHPWLAWRWKKWHSLNLIPERWHHSPSMRRQRPDWTAAAANQSAHTWEEFKKDSEQCRKVVQKPHEQVRARLKPAEGRNTKKKERKERKTNSTHGFVRDFSLFVSCLGPRAVTCSSIFKALLISLTVNNSKHQDDNTFQERPSLRTFCRGQE